MNRYICQSCGATFNCSRPYRFCPDCGKGGTITQDHRRARETALRTIEELKMEDIPVMESIFANYIAQRVKVEAKMQTLRTYKRRGIVTEEEMPIMSKPKLQEELKKYRAKEDN